MGQVIVAAHAQGAVLNCTEGLSFWGGVDAQTGVIIDAHHPQFGQSLAGRVVVMPTSRGSCSGSGVLLTLAMNANAPAALVFRAPEDILTLGALIATRMYDSPVAVLRLPSEEYDVLAAAEHADITETAVIADDQMIPLAPLRRDDLSLTGKDTAMLAGEHGAPTQLAMEMICTMAAVQGAEALLDVTCAHIDGCIYAGEANLIFAQTMRDMGAQVVVPTTLNAISVDHAHWRSQGVPELFGTPASRLADAYTDMGAAANFTCAPYHADTPPQLGENIGWSESNAVIYANTVLGARSVKHPDFFDLFVAMTGRAPQSGVYLTAQRAPRAVVHVVPPQGYDDAFWPLLGWALGQLAPDYIPLVTGLAHTTPSADDLRAVCAAFGTTSAAPMLHIAGITPEADPFSPQDLPQHVLSKRDLGRSWDALNSGPEAVDLVALGSPHFSLNETRKFASLMSGRRCHGDTTALITFSRATRDQAQGEGLLDVLEAAGVQTVTDLCWCSISEPVFPPDAQALMTNSGKYAHYAPGLSGRAVRFGGLAQCADTAVQGSAPKGLPAWLI
ncbi:MAG: aconitase family protein [Sulfitobacter sp.]